MSFFSFRCPDTCANGFIDVYNAENVARVRKDEEEARKKEEEEEYRMQIADAESRMDRLRRRITGGDPEAHEKPPTISASEYPEQRSAKRARHESSNLALAQTATGRSRTTATDQLTDKDGHLNIFLETDGTRSQKIRPKKASQPEPASFTLRELAPELKPWYSSTTLVGEKQAAKSEKQTEKEQLREERARAGNDPLADMKRQLKATKDYERQRAELEAERKRELLKLKKEDLEGFSLDSEAPARHDRHRERGYKTSSGRDKETREKRRSDERRSDKRHRSRSPYTPHHDKGHRSERHERKRNRERSRSKSRDGRSRKTGRENSSRHDSDSHRRHRRSRSRHDHSRERRPRRDEKKPEGDNLKTKNGRI